MPRRSSHEERGLKLDTMAGTGAQQGRSSHEERGLKFDELESHYLDEQSLLA